MVNWFGYQHMHPHSYDFSAQKNHKLPKDLQKRGQVADDILNAHYPKISGLSNSSLREKTSVFKAGLADGKKLDDILSEAFAVVCEAAWRTLHQRHFLQQLIGGQVLHEGKIAEMQTGEGKTLVATLPTYLNALTGKGVHVITVNDYLAKRDATWMGQIYHFLGLSVGVIQSTASYLLGLSLNRY